jgi:hypothetical protein
VQSGDRIEVVLTIESKNDAEYVLLEDEKPAGFEAVEVKSGQGLVARAIKSTSLSRTFGTLDDAHANKGLSAASDDIDYTGAQASLYEELRDRKVALFASKLAQGVWEVRYELRAEVPGAFHALPVIAQAMYVPKVRGNSAEVRITVVDVK